MIYYPLSALMLAGIRDISHHHDAGRFRSVQPPARRRQPVGRPAAICRSTKPEGLAQAFIIGADFIGDDPVALVLGDNIFFGHGLSELLERRNDQQCRRHGVRLSGQDPERYGVVSFDDNGFATELVEKPQCPSRMGGHGTLFLRQRRRVGCEVIKPSHRGETGDHDVK